MPLGCCSGTTTEPVKNHKNINSRVFLSMLLNKPSLNVPYFFLKMKNNIVNAKTKYNRTHHQLVASPIVMMKPGIRSIDSKWNLP